jgi:hypothetical protein
MTGRFWLCLILLSVAWSGLFFWAGTSPKGAGGWRRFPGQAYRYQFEKYPRGRWGFSRIVRMHLIFTLGFFYWNAVVAPALYGNEQARSYLDNAAVRFDEGAANSYELKTLYVAPANDLAANRERYFLFYPTNIPVADFSTLQAKLGGEGRQRWTCSGAEKGGRAMREVVFASGSPFPIFAPHLYPQHPKENQPAERLVDGGFAHNNPLEAAKQVGARQVLLLNSAPDTKLGSPPRILSRTEAVFGQLTRNLPLLLPFLFERSQVADLLSQEEMCIIAISPEPRKWWPPLFDFRRTTVTKLLQAADEDANRRIGRIVTCGPPVFATAIRMARMAE